MEYRKRLNPGHSLRMPKRIEGIRQKAIVTHNPSEIDQNQLLLVRFPNLGHDDVIIPGTANLSFNIELTSTADLNRTLVSNVSVNSNWVHPPRQPPGISSENLPGGSEFDFQKLPGG